MAAEDQVAVVFAATNGFLDRIDADRVAEFHQGLTERLHADANDSIEQFADDFGYDLDEEGHPLEDRDETTREQEGIRSSSDADSDSDSAPLPDDGGDETDDTEEAGAVRAS